MSYNVGPEHTHSGLDRVKCPDCGEVVRPEWDGCDGEYRCPNCYETLEKAS